jgi:putative restriction endonuclease
MQARLLIQLLRDPAWDLPFFKRLAHNDTGQAVGHQGGIVVPKDLRIFFPTLDEGSASATAPTVDRNLSAEMFIPGQQVARDTIRYQLQTWGGTRPAESRITDNLGPIRNIARAGDLLIMQRNRERLHLFRLVLVRQSDQAFRRFNALTVGRTWGALFADEPPISQTELIAARAAMLDEARQPFVAVRAEIPGVASSRAATARATAFRATLLAEYQRCCAVSGIALTTRSVAEAHAAHVVPLGEGGADEPRNGLALTSTLHWAFDHGLFSVSEDRRVIVPRSVSVIRGNEWLRQFDNAPIREANSASLRTAPEAFAWHRENKMWR